jgi:hypothetical protein
LKFSILLLSELFFSLSGEWRLTRVETGMRRPSWNKSQAIQQVLSLKALYEPGDDSGAGILRKILVSQPPNPPRVSVVLRFCFDLQRKI